LPIVLSPPFPFCAGFGISVTLDIGADPGSYPDGGSAGCSGGSAGTSGGSGSGSIGSPGSNLPVYISLLSSLSSLSRLLPIWVELESCVGLEFDVPFTGREFPSIGRESGISKGSVSFWGSGLFWGSESGTDSSTGSGWGSESGIDSSIGWESVSGTDSSTGSDSDVRFKITFWLNLIEFLLILMFLVFLFKFLVLKLFLM